MTMLDRRRYFRINDTVGLHYRVLGSESTAEGDGAGVDLQVPAAQILGSIDKEFRSSLDSLWQNNPAAANAISLLNKKVELLAAELELDSALSGTEEYQSVNVNISACGIAFECNDQFRRGETLELFLILRPANTRLTLTGQVVSCERRAAGGENRFLLRADFQGMPLDIEEQLIQHIVKRQSGQLAQQRQQS